MRAADLLLSSGPFSNRIPEVNPLVERDALLEAQVLDLRFDLARGVLGVLFELRVAMHLHESNTAVLVAKGVETLRWRADQRTTDLTAWNILSSDAEKGSADLHFGVVCYPDASLRVRAAHFTYLNCQVNDIGDAPPDYASATKLIWASTAHWQSEVHVVSASSLGK